MTEERPIDEIVKQIETLIASMPYDITLDDDELRNEICKNKSFLLEGLRRGISVDRIFRVIRCSPIWATVDTLETWVIGPDTGKGVDMKKINEELWKELEEYEKRDEE